MRIGIDLGGSKIEGILLDAVGRECGRLRVATPKGDYAATLNTIYDLVKKLEMAAGISDSTIGIATPGALSLATGLIKNSNSTCLIGKPLNRDLEKLLARPIRMSNDANCFALSEATDGAAREARVVFGVILGTGVGGGIVVDAKVLTGFNSICGEWGHNPLPWPEDMERPGPLCYCKKYGCIESFLSGPGLERDFFNQTGQKKSAIEISQLEKNNDDAAIKCLQTYEDRLARALATVINILDPEVIVLGGGVSNIDRLYETVPPLLSDLLRTKLVKARFGDSSGVRGAAWLW